jgi:hypothetical protein
MTCTCEESEVVDHLYIIYQRLSEDNKKLSSEVLSAQKMLNEVRTMLKDFIESERRKRSDELARRRERCW